jgi:hypothetical protein
MNHARNDVGATYDLYEREREKRAAVQALSKDIERIVFREAIGRKQ